MKRRREDEGHVCTERFYFAFSWDAAADLSGLRELVQTWKSHLAGLPGESRGEPLQIPERAHKFAYTHPRRSAVQTTYQQSRNPPACVALLIHDAPGCDFLVRRRRCQNKDRPKTAAPASRRASIMATASRVSVPM